MGRGKRQRDDDEDHHKPHHNRHNQQQQRGGGYRGYKASKQQYHHRSDSVQHEEQSQQSGEGKLLPYHVKAQLPTVIHKPAAPRPVVELNEFGRHVTLNLLSPSFTLYAKNFVPTIDANPHIEQIRGGIVTVKKESELTRVLADDAPQMAYRRRRGEVKSVVHWGQRKLMVSEIEFLTLHGGKDSDNDKDLITCVYAGSAPGTHIPFLAQLFPKVRFVLVDPSEFSIEATDRIEIRREFMTDDVAREFVGRRTLLISDIRSADFKVMSNADMEAAVKR
jgi:hypothetical protein